MFSFMKKMTKLLPTNSTLPGARPGDGGAGQALRERPSAQAAVPRRPGAGDVRHGLLLGRRAEVLAAAGRLLTAVGYAGGHTPNPTYEEVCSGHDRPHRGRAGRVRSARVSYEELLKVFWENHDPTQGMRQGNDVGTQYRSAIYYLRRRAARAPPSARATLPGGARRGRLRRRSRPRSRRRPSSITPRIITSSTSARTRTATAASAAPACRCPVGVVTSA